MPNYIRVFIEGYSGYASYLWHEINHPSFKNYFYWLIFVSLIFFFLEFFSPWRKEQKKFRQDFWLDVFYMFFNFFLFSLLIYNAASDVVVDFFNYHIENIFGHDLSQINPMFKWPLWAVLLIGFVVRDFVQWWTHRLLHRIDFLWQFHKVHHSVKEMGFAAHLRYHWMETIVYRSLEYIPLALLGIGLYDFFIIHIFTLVVGHYNHSNIHIDKKITGGIIGGIIGVVLGFELFEIVLPVYLNQLPSLFVVAFCVLIGVFILSRIVDKLFNSPGMHIWHHAYHLPNEYRYGVNFGLTLAIWDYLFGTAYIPYNGRDIPLGFPEDNEFPKTFHEQVIYGFSKK